jgi:hypothetical protein
MPSSWFALRRTSALALVALAAAASHPAAFVGTPPQAGSSLTRPSAQAIPRNQAPPEPWEGRRRSVSFNTAAVPARAEPGAMPDAGAQVTIDLFDGRSITAMFERFDPNTSGVTWVGRVPGLPHSRVTLVSGGGLLAASIMLPDASYTILPQSIGSLEATPAPADTVHVLTELNPGGFAPEAPPLLAEVEQMAAAHAAETTMTDAADLVDLLVVYTRAAEFWAGGHVGVTNLINLAVSQVNSGLSSSGVFTQIRLAGVERVDYTEVGTFGTDLTNLRAGVVPDVLTMREAYTADLVALIVRPAIADACGIAFLMTTPGPGFAPNGFSVTDAPCIGQATLAHELGHNMGLRHDWFVDAGLTPFTYAHGYVNVPGRFRTIMAYADQCSTQGISCPRIVAFSNPEQTLAGQPLGVPAGTSIACQPGNANNPPCDADERLALGHTALTVANFREFSTLRPPLIVSHPSSQLVQRGQAVTLQVAAEGLGPMSYQWFRGASPSTASPIPGATSSTFTVIPGGDDVWFERWFYWVRVANVIGATSSLTATVTLLQPGAAPAPGRRTGLPQEPGLRGGRQLQRTAPPAGAARPRPAETPPGPSTRGAATTTEAATKTLAPCEDDPEWAELLAIVAAHPWPAATAARLLTWLIGRAAWRGAPACQSWMEHTKGR